jgi:predicted glycoside hydrolase/deacetylase ChbG (UPF0249 family)
VKRLVVNADDFGFTRDVNAGILEAHRDGILTATTLMANGAAFEDAVSMAQATPSLDIGCHLVLAGGRSMLDPRRNLPCSVSALLRAVAFGRLRIYDELAAQVRRIVEAGVRPTHLDTHKHTHLLPPVLEAVARISRDFAIPWVRRPFDFPLRPGRVPWTKRTVSGAFTGVRGHFHRVLTRYGCRTTDHFAGFQITGRFGPHELVELIHALPEGTTEFMCHPGRCGAELQAASTRLKQSREVELQALTAPEVRAALRAAGVDLVNYRELSAAAKLSS